MIFLTATLGALRRPTVFIVMNPAASSLAKVRVRFGCDRALMSAKSAGLGLLVSNHGEECAIFGSQQPHDGLDKIEARLCASVGAGCSPRATAFISSLSDRRL
jgi:hypothetical protein